MLQVRFATVAVASLLSVTSFASPLKRSYSSLPAQSIAVDGVQVPGNRVVIFHAPDANLVFVKTVEAGSTLNVRTGQSPLVYHFDLCKVPYKNLNASERLDRINDFVNSAEAECRRINETVFAENDVQAKLGINQAMELQLDKQINRVTSIANNKKASKVGYITQAVGITSFFVVGLAVVPYLQRWIPILKNPTVLNGVSLASGAALISGAIFGNDLLAAYRAKHNIPAVTADPSVANNDPFIYATLELPPGLSAKEAAEALQAAFDKATRSVYHRLQLARSVPAT